MRAVIQRVTQASVTVGEEIVGSIGRGLCVLVGFHEEDNATDMEYVVRKILNARLFESEGKKWDKSVRDMDLQVLSVSQFTLYGSFKGNKLDFHHSMPNGKATEFYQAFLQQLKTQYKPDKIEDGRFGAMMSVKIANDGPVTITIDSKSR